MKPQAKIPTSACALLVSLSARLRGVRPKRAAAALALAAAIAGGSDFAYRYWTVGRFLESTDDAYLKADYTTIAPKVSGYVAEVLVDDNQRVRRGQVLARIDDRDFHTALAQARAAVAASEADIRNIDARIALQAALIAQARADIDAAAAALDFAKQEFGRYRHLMTTGYGSVQRAQQADAALREKTAVLARGKAALLAAERLISVLDTQRAKAVTQRESGRAALRQAELNLGYTTIVSPIDGTVGARSLRVGQYVQAGTQLMAVVPLRAVYVVANFKETQLAHMRAGLAVAIAVDGLPGVTLRGRIDSLSPASGLVFALLPPDNATGNFTKIVQRIPVKIVLDDGDRLAGRLRPGMSVIATVDTKPTVAAAREDKITSAVR